MSSERKTRVRPSEFRDFSGVAAVLKRNGMGELEAEVWRSRWHECPYAQDFEGIPLGWVLETEDGEIVGNLDNAHVLYELDGARLRGVVAAGWAVDPEWRTKSITLMATFFRQKGPDLRLNVSASPTVAELLTALRIARIPIPDYGTPCLWAAGSRSFALAALRKRHAPAAGLLAWGAGFAIWGWDAARRSGRGRIGSSRIAFAADFDERFDAFGRALSEAGGRLRAVRSREILGWRYAAERRSGNLRILIAERGSGIAGYAVLVLRDAPELGVNIYDIVDLQSAGDDPSIFRDLIISAVQCARRDGIGAVKLLTGTPARRGPALALRPWTYQVAHWQQYFQASAELAAKLTKASDWDFSPFESY
jgi:hypothetical protein